MDKDSVLHSIRQRTTLSTKDITDLKRRADELSWLHDNDMLARSIPDSEIPIIVAHRGKLLLCVLICISPDMNDERFFVSNSYQLV